MHGRGLVIKTITPYTTRGIGEYEVLSHYKKLSDLLDEEPDFDPAVVDALRSYDPEREVVTMFQRRGYPPAPATWEIVQIWETW